MSQTENGELRFALEDDINASVFSGVVSQRPQMWRTDESIYADFTVASRDSRPSARGAVKHTNYIDVRVYDELAEYCCEQLRKGMPVLVDGMLDYYEIKTGERGKRSGLRVSAYKVRPYSRSHSAQAAARSQLHDALQGAPGRQRA